MAQTVPDELYGLMETSQLDIFMRLNPTCTAKCNQRNSSRSELMKNEAVCIDRCVTKYFEFHEEMSRLLANNPAGYKALADKPDTKALMKNNADSQT